MIYATGFTQRVRVLKIIPVSGEGVRVNNEKTRIPKY